MEFTVERKTWARGDGDNRLLGQDGTRCCIGFCGLQTGFSDEALLNKRWLQGCDGDIDVKAANPLLRKVRADDGFFDIRDQIWVDRAYTINDSHDMTDEVRESKLAALFTANGHTIAFVDSMEPATT